MKKKTALIFGITGQDGSYLAELLLKKNYIVNGVKRRSSSINTSRVDHIYQDPHEKNYRFRLHYGDITDSTSVSSLIKKTQPDEIYNLAAQSHVAVSFEVPEYTANADALGALRILEAIKFHKLTNKTKFYQAGTSELFGNVQTIPQNEKTPFYPLSPYGVAKLYAHWITINYRESYNIFGCNGILFNHESPRRGELFVTRKVTKTLSEIKVGIKKGPLELGNMDANRDWGHAKDYVRGMWMMLQADQPDDYILSMEEQHSVRDFVNISCKHLGFDIEWSGEGIDEVGIDRNTGKTIVQINPEYYRPTEVETLIGDCTKVKTELGWKPEYTFEKLVEEMCESDLKLAMKKKNEFVH